MSVFVFGIASIVSRVCRYRRCGGFSRYDVQINVYDFVFFSLFLHGRLYYPVINGQPVIGDAQH